MYLHQYYQLFTSILVTDSPIDAGFNAVAVLILDRLTEDNLNKTRYFIVFFSTAVVGNLLTLAQGPAYSSAGASGGIFGIYAALITFSWLKSKQVDVPSLVLFLVIFLGSSVLPDVNYVAHIGGAFSGFIIGALIYRSVRPTITEYSMAYDSSMRTVVITWGAIILLAVASAFQFLVFAGF